MNFAVVSSRPRPGRLPIVQSRDSFSLSPSTREILIKAVIFFALYWVVVNIVYIAAASVDDSNQGLKNVNEAADGSTFKKLAVTFMFIASVFLVGFRRMYYSISKPYVLALVFFGCSALWAVNPGISFRRWLSLVMTLVTMTSSLSFLGPKKSLEIIYVFLSVLLVFSLSSVLLAYAKIPLFSFAIHPGDEADATLIGAWRGPMLHKNTAGAVMTHAAIFFAHHAINRKKLQDFAFFAGSILFLVGTHSKTSMGLAGFVLAVSFLYRACAIRKGGTQLFGFSLLFVILSASIIAITLHGEIARFFSVPGNISGRVGIWMSLIAYLQNHWLLGAGYGSFWTIGMQSPIFQYAVKPFIQQIGHSHSGYFEILVTGGVVGLVLALYALVFWPLYRFLTVSIRDGKLFALCFGMWFFGVLQNFTEAQFFAPDKQSWLFILIAIAIANQVAVTRSAEPLRKKGYVIEDLRNLRVA